MLSGYFGDPNGKRDWIETALKHTAGRRRDAALLLGWLLLAFGGVLAIVQAKPSASYLGDHYLLGFALALGAAFCYALVVLLNLLVAIMGDTWQRVKESADEEWKFLMVC